MNWFLFLLMLLCSVVSRAQSFKVNISSKHESKIVRIKSGHKRCLRYYKYYRKDSIYNVKERQRMQEKFLDSIWQSSKLTKGREQGLKLELFRDSIFNSKFRKWNSLMGDRLTHDSTRDELRILALEKAKQYPGFQATLERYQLGNDSLTWDDLAKQAPGLDTLSDLFNSSPDELSDAADKSIERYFSGESSFAKLSEGTQSLEQLNSLYTDYKRQYEQYTDKESLKQQGKDKAAEKAIDYFADHERELGAAQKKVSKLLGKYREFTNSENLEDAVKHTSMKGKTFKEHLVLGGNFNVISTEPISIDVSPQVGYKITTKFFVALGMSYRLSFRDSIRNSKYVSPHNTSFELSTSYDLIKSFYAYAEWKKSGIKINSEPKTYRWMDNYFIGIGKRFLVHPKVYLTLTALYNLNNTDNNPAYPKRFQIRVGFQLSELATRKKKIYYDPNR